MVFKVLFIIAIIAMIARLGIKRAATFQGTVLSVLAVFTFCWGILLFGGHQLVISGVRTRMPVQYVAYEGKLYLVVEKRKQVKLKAVNGGQVIEVSAQQIRKAT